MKSALARVVLFTSLTMLLVACGEPQTSSNSVQKASTACEGSAMPQQFIVKHLDGSMAVVQAESEEALINGYMKVNRARIAYAEHDFTVRSALPIESETTVVAKAAAPDNWGPIKIEADKLWAQNVRGEGVIVAIVDSGMDLEHAQLKNQIAVNAGEAGTDSRGKDKRTNGIDDDRNGYVDDYAGYDFVPDEPQPLKGDYQHHGTHVSGIVAAAHDDTVAAPKSYVQGVAPKAKLLPVAFLDDQGSGAMSNGVRAIQYAVQRGAKVINASWGGTQCSITLKNVIEALAEQDIVFVSAAGNDSANVDMFMEYPASLNLTAQITVGATGDHDLMAQYSNYGKKAVHIFAPGSNIISTLPGGTFGNLSGTSMATPFVTGAVALLLSAVPDANVTQIRNALYNSAQRNAGYVNASQGRLDLNQAVTELRRIVGQ